MSIIHTQVWLLDRVIIYPNAPKFFLPEASVSTVCSLIGYINLHPRTHASRLEI